jgi:hypothetical protein
MSKETKEPAAEAAADVEVIATERGHCGTRVREEGEVFTVPAKRLEDGSTWFVPLAKAPAAKEATAKDPKARPPGAGPLPSA